MDSEQKRRILDAHMHLPTQGISLSEKKEILLKEMQKNGIDEGIVISDSAITSEIGSSKDCLELFSDTCYVHVVGGISPFFNYKEQCKLLDTALSEKKIVGIKLFADMSRFICQTIYWSRFMRLLKHIMCQCCSIRKKTAHNMHPILPYAKRYDNIQISPLSAVTAIIRM